MAQKTKEQTVTDERMYEVADKLFEAYEPQVNKEKLLDENEKQYRNYVFGVLLHTPDKNGVELIDNFDLETATHIVNLALRRFRDTITKVVVDY